MGLLGYRMNNNQLKILFCYQAVKGKMAYGNSLGFQVQIDDLRLQCCMLGDNFKNKSSGRKQ